MVFEQLWIIIVGWELYAMAVLSFFWPNRIFMFSFQWNATVHWLDTIYSSSHPIFSLCMSHSTLCEKHKRAMDPIISSPHLVFWVIFIMYICRKKHIWSGWAPRGLTTATALEDFRLNPGTGDKKRWISTLLSLSGIVFEATSIALFIRRAQGPITVISPVTWILTSTSKEQGDMWKINTPKSAVGWWSWGM